MARTFMLVALLGFVGCTCSGPPERELYAPSSPVAVGAEALVTATSRTCRTYFYDRQGSVGGGRESCTSERITVVSASLEDPSLFEVAILDNRVQLTARSPGQTLLHLEAQDVGGSEFFSASVEARHANRIEAALVCDEGVEPTTLYQVGTKFQVRVTAFDDELQLTGVPPSAVRSDVASFEGPESSPRFTASDARGMGALTSEYDPNFHLLLRIFDPGEVSVDAPQPISEYGLTTASFRLHTLVDGSRPCIDTAVRHFEILTQDVCTFSPPTVEPAPLTFEKEVLGSAPAVARRIKAGTCTVRALRLDRPDLAVDRSHTF